MLPLPVMKTMTLGCPMQLYAPLTAEMKRGKGQSATAALCSEVAKTTNSWVTPVNDEAREEGPWFAGW
jgi:hypothetical protein